MQKPTERIRKQKNGREIVVAWPSKEMQACPYVSRFSCGLFTVLDAILVTHDGDDVTQTSCPHEKCDAFAKCVRWGYTFTYSRSWSQAIAKKKASIERTDLMCACVCCACAMCLSMALAFEAVRSNEALLRRVRANVYTPHMQKCRVSCRAARTRSRWNIAFALRVLLFVVCDPRNRMCLCGARKQRVVGFL